MIRSVYAAAAAMITDTKLTAKVANNIANLETPGFKRDVIRATGFETMLMDEMSGAPVATSEQGYLGQPLTAVPAGYDPSQGRINDTRGALDLALSGPGYFTVDRGGETLYTRNGSFVRDAEGYVRTLDGGFVLGDGGRLRLPEGEIAVDPAGGVLVDGAAAGKLALADFNAGADVQRVGNSYLKPASGAAAPATRAEVRQNCLEESNVDMSQAMMDITMIARSYETCQRIVQMCDQSAAEAANQVGKLA